MSSALSKIELNNISALLLPYQKQEDHGDVTSDKWITRNCGLLFTEPNEDNEYHHKHNRGILIHPGHVYQEVDNNQTQITHITTPSGEKYTICVRKTYV